MTKEHDEQDGGAWRCDRCGRSPVRDCLDGEALCQRCCNQWARGEGNSEAARLRDIDERLAMLELLIRTAAPAETPEPSNG